MTDNWTEAGEAQDSRDRAHRKANPGRAKLAARRFRRLARDLGVSPRELRRDLARGDAPRGTRGPNAWEGGTW